LAEVVRMSRLLRDEEARPVQRTLDHTWTKLAYDPHLPCTDQGFLAASGAVSGHPARKPVSVPHSCHDVWRTAVIGSHSKALEMTSDLEVSRSASTMK